MEKKILILFGILFLLTIVTAAVPLSCQNQNVWGWAWNDVIGWIDFCFDGTGNINVYSDRLGGYASSSVGYIAFDCATSPNGNICTASSTFRVSNSNGYLSGFAWNDAIGWISFDCHDLNQNPPCTTNYQVIINPNGEFTGWAWNDIIGWISFNCGNSGTLGCDPGTGGSNYKVKTSWSATAAIGTLLSSVFDTRVPGGAAFNSIMWRGSQPAGTAVKFQFASTSTLPAILDPIGPGGTSNPTDTYPAARNTPVPLSRLFHNNHRYFRYKIILQSDASRTFSPRVDDIIINWSP